MRLDTNKTKVIIFDIGNVLIEFAWEAYLHNLGYEGEVFEHVADAMFRSKQWDAGDSGLVTTQEWVDLMVKNDPAYEKEIRDAFANFGETIVPYAITEEWLAYLKEKGMKLYFLSNYAEEMYRQSKDRLTFLDGFDGGIFSWKEKCMKPNHEIYKRLLERYNIDPSEAMFFDDKKENVDAARELGIEAVVFTTDIPLQMMEK